MIFKSVFWAYTHTATQLITGFLITPYMIHTLGDEQYGLLISAANIASYGSILELGMPQAVARLSGYCYGKNNLSESHEIFNGALWLSLSILFILTSVSFFSWFFQKNTPFFLISLMFVSAQFSYLLSTMGMFLGAHQKIHLHHVGNTLFITLKSIALYLALSHKNHILTSPFITIATQTIHFFLYLFFIKTCTSFKYSFPSIHLQELHKKTLKTGLASLIASTPSNFLPRTAPLAIYTFANTSQVTSYNIAYTFISYIISACSSGSSFLSHSFAFLDGANKQQESKKLFLTSTSVLSFIACGLIFFSIASYPSLVVLWLKKPYVESHHIFTILGIAHILALIQISSLQLFNGKGHYVAYGKYLFLELAIQLFFFYFLKPCFTPTLAAYAFAVPCIVVRGFAIPIHSAKILHIRTLSYFKEMMPPFFSASLASLPLYLYYKEPSFQNIACSLLTFVFLYLLLLFFYTFLHKKFSCMYAEGFDLITSKTYHTLKTFRL